MLQRGEDVLAMSLRQVRDSRRQGADEMLRAFGWLAVVRRRSLQKCFERHANDI
jgi:hypothetical protein